MHLDFQRIGRGELNGIFSAARLQTNRFLTTAGSPDLLNDSLEAQKFNKALSRSVAFEDFLFTASRPPWSHAFFWAHCRRAV